MKEALFYEKKEKGFVRCLLCPNRCLIPPDTVLSEKGTGWCGVRHNIDGVLYTSVYEKPVSIAVDPVEKKPLFHFFPGEQVLSVGTFGCNLHCKNCQNFSISQKEYFFDRLRSDDYGSLSVSPEEVVDLALSNGLRLLALTYNEPTIFFEYGKELLSVAKKKGLKTIIVSNGLIEEAPLKEWVGLIDAANIDIKSFNDDFYKEVSGVLRPVVDRLKNNLLLMKDRGVHLEITHLAIPGYSTEEVVGEIASWISNNLGPDTPFHITRFFPYYKMVDKKPTSKELLVSLKRVAEKYLARVYLGNV